MRHDESVSLRDRELSRGRFGEDDSTNSLSGHERNHLFVRDAAGSNFVDISSMSGLDHEADGRSFALFDYDRDGWQDLVVVNANDPALLLYRNRTSAAPSAAAEMRMFAVTLVGANNTSVADAARSPRDAYGARITARVGGATIRRDLQCGEGLAAQNSKTVTFGLGSRAGADSLAVHWPSGRITEVGEVPAGSVITLYEDPTQAPESRGYVIRPYRLDAGSTSIPSRAGPQTRFAIHGESDARLSVYTTMATWCAVCRGELPHVRRLRETFPSDALGLFGIPIDGNDSKQMLELYVAQHRPAYQLVDDLSPLQLDQVRRSVRQALRIDALPASIVCDEDGTILVAMIGVPTVSMIRALLENL